MLVYKHFITVHSNGKAGVLYLKNVVLAAVFSVLIISRV